MANDIGPPPTGTAWDEDAPALSDAHGNGALEIRDLRMGLRLRLQKEHTTPAGSTAGGEHKQGSAVAWIQDTAPTTRPDGSTALTSADLGRIWIDTTNNVIKSLTAIGSPNTWTPAGELALALYTAGNEPDRGLYMKGNELYFKGADGTEKPMAGMLDEDDMTSDSDTQVPSQQSVKAYVDAAVTDANTYADAAVAAVIVDEDDMASDSADHVPTQQSVKAYVDAGDAARCQANGTVVHNAALTPDTWTDLDLSGQIGSAVALVYLEVQASKGVYFAAKPKGYGSGTFDNHYGGSSLGASFAYLGTSAKVGYVVCMTDSSGIIRIGANNNATITLKLVGFLK